MVINNKYQVGQRLYFLDHDGKAKCEVVKCVNIFVYKDSVNISYSFQELFEYKYENEVFPTEEAFLRHVFGDVVDFNKL